MLAGSTCVRVAKDGRLGGPSSVPPPTSQTIPEGEIWEFKECFTWFDKDGDGFIRGLDLPTAVRAMGQYWSFADLRDLTTEFPPSSKINFQQFLSICSRKYGYVPDVTDIEHAFEVFHREETGRVLLQDLRHMLCTVGEKLTEAEFDELCALNNIPYQGGSQSISKDEFLRMFGVDVQRGS